MLVVITLFVSVGIFWIYIFINLVNYLFNPASRKDKEHNNFYIRSHVARRENDRQYQEYLEWMDRTNSSLPINKIKTQEEVDFEIEMDKLFKK